MPENNENTNEKIFVVSWFKNERDNRPYQEEVSWPVFCKILSTHHVRTAKEGGKAWSPAHFFEGKTRCKQNVKYVSFAVIDSDSGANIEVIARQLNGVAHLIHTSFSHTAEHPKFRVIIPLERSVPAAEWDQVWQRINAWLGNINDSAVKDASRLYFLPAKPKDASGHQVIVHDGRTLDVDQLPAMQPVMGFTMQEDIKTNTQGTKLQTVEGIEGSPEFSPKEGLVEVVNRCAFMQWVSSPQHQANVPEPLWMAMISNAVRFEGSGEWIHDASQHHPEYDEKKTNAKIQSCTSWPKPVGCNRIRELGFKECPTEGCALRTGLITKAPAGLVSWMFKPREVPKTTSDLALASKELQMPEPIKKFVVDNFPNGLVFLNESFYAYDGGYFRRLHERVDVRQVIAYQLAANARAKEINDMFGLLKDFLAIKEESTAPNKALICLSNGTLDTNSYTLLSHSPEHRLMVKTDIEWTPDAKYSRWMKFLDEIFEYDFDKAQKIAFLQEWFGYCLVPDNTQHKFVWMVGAGGNGKSVLLNILRKLVGEANVSNAHIERLDEKFVRVELVGKLLNISSEMSSEATVADSYLKEIVAGDVIEAERKYQPSFSFRPYVRLVGATNHLPRLLDTSDGFFRRAIVISFNRQFIGDQCDPQLEGRLVEELPGILVWAVDGLKRLRERGQFDIPQSSTAQLAQYRKDSNPVVLISTQT